jgi:hypothetical protein
LTGSKIPVNLIKQIKLMKAYLSFFFLFVSSYFYGQMWAPPGATWHYSVYVPNMNWWYDGVYELNYTNTVTVNSIVCKQITGKYVGISGFQNGPTQTISNYPIFKTYEDNAVVYLYNSESNAFDTIVNFNAAIGDKWRIIEFVKAPSQPCSTMMAHPIVTVLDTNHVTINGFNLKRIVVSWQLYGNTITETIIERLSCISAFLFPKVQCVVDGPAFGRFICYSDNTFPQYMIPGVETCQFVRTNIEELSGTGGNIRYFPSPVTDKLKINLGHQAENFKLRFTNALGYDISVSQWSIEGEIVELDCSLLKSGIYLVTISSDYGNRSFKVVKE